jgi:hypothetical protein
MTSDSIHRSASNGSDLEAIEARLDWLEDFARRAADRLRQHEGRLYDVGSTADDAQRTAREASDLRDELDGA